MSKKQDLIAIIENQEMNTDDKYKAIMAVYGTTISELQEQVKQIAPLQQENETLKAKNQELVEGQSKYADYEDLKAFKETTVANEVKQQKLDFLTSRKCKHPDLLLEAIDWSKGKYDSNNKTFTGLDDALENVKGQYADLFETDMQQPGSKGISFILSGSDNNDQNATGTSRMNDFLRGNQ